MTKTIHSPIFVEEKNHWLGKLAFAALVALKLPQWDGKAALNAQSENLFLLRWLQTALKKKRFHRCVVHDFEWLINLGQQRLMTSKLKSRLEYLWRSCCCDIASQSDLFRLTYASELLKDLGWDRVVLNKARWHKLIATKPVVEAIPTFYVTQPALTAGFSDDGKQIASVNFWVHGDSEQFNEVIKQHHLCGQFDDTLPQYTLSLC
ncbi:DUF2913 family protein [Providencia rettgeri]|uniref:DUF2913 family protein n=1 Tax=Providencia rettgeri TaxID=587 RepID=UPI0030194D6E